MNIPNLLRVAAPIALAAALSACGGGGGSSHAAGESSTAAEHAAPALNSQRSFAQQIIDNSNNTINESTESTVTAVNADGSFTVRMEDPSHDTVTLDGRTYSVRTETAEFNSSGHEVSYTYAQPDGTSITCTYSPQGPGPEHAPAVGDSWTASYTMTCGNEAPIAYTQVGSVVDTESLNVPAGTFNTLKLQSTISWTDHNGTTHTESTDNWIDVNGTGTVEEQITYSYSGTPLTTGYPVSLTRILQSHS